LGTMKSFSGKAFEPSIEEIAAVSVYFAERAASRIAEEEDLDARVWDSAAMSCVRLCRLSSCVEAHSGWLNGVMSSVRTGVLIPSVSQLTTL
jgi:hypothetical protein